jgi:hypothetical protein
VRAYSAAIETAIGLARQAAAEISKPDYRWPDQPISGHPTGAAAHDRRTAMMATSVSGCR